MKEYYRRRAKVFDEDLYAGRDPVRQKELQKITDVSKEVLKARRVVDVACGTAYWTQIVSEVAQSIIGTDFAEEMLRIAETKKFMCPVSFCKADAFNLPFKPDSFNGGMADFWFSHVPKEKIETFLEDFHSPLERGSIVVMADNVYVAGVGGEFVRKEGEVDTYKIRKLGDGTDHLVLKNYFSIDELVSIFSRHAHEFGRQNVFYGKHYWCLFYRLK